MKDILRFMGLLIESDKKYSLHYVKNVLITVPMVVLLLPLCGYLVSNGNNLLSATDVFYVIAADCLCIGQYWFLVVQKGPLLDLLSELQALIDQSKCQIERFRVIDGGQFGPSILFSFSFPPFWIDLFQTFFLVVLGEVDSRLFYKFVLVERQVYMFTKQMKAFVTFASTICLFLPCIYAAIRFILGIYSDKDWYLPYKFK